MWPIGDLEEGGHVGGRQADRCGIFRPSRVLRLTVSIVASNNRLCLNAANSGLGASMAEEPEFSESIDASGVDPVALGAAMKRASSKVDEQLSAYLAEQRHLMAAQFAPQMRQLHLGIWEKRLGVFLRLATALVGVGVAGALGFMVWSAATSNGLMIEPFSVPPDLAERGLTGQVLAAKLQDRLALMERNTNSLRPAKSYANSWGEHAIKLDIPETGISLTELDDFLRAKLGHDINVSGEVVHVASGLVLTRAPATKARAAWPARKPISMRWCSGWPSRFIAPPSPSAMACSW
jgi:hypothetical protein